MSWPQAGDLSMAEFATVQTQEHGECFLEIGV